MFVSHSVVCDSLQPHRLQPASLLCPWTSPGKKTGVGNPFLLQGIFPTQSLNPDLLHWRWILYHLSHRGIPKEINQKLKLISNKANGGTIATLEILISRASWTIISLHNITENGFDSVLKIKYNSGFYIVFL